MRQVVAHLGVAQDTIYRWIDTRALPAHRIGRRWRFKLSEID
ncbi:MAG: helix-turn-helix domain-containing protein [Acidobacteriia bacterium]|nr:helix-turn-helix domain-containing protein [Terriglobia bacterium]